MAATHLDGLPAEWREGVPEENWLLLNRGDYDLDIIMPLYSPDLRKSKTWTPPKAARL